MRTDRLILFVMLAIPLHSILVPMVKSDGWGFSSFLLPEGKDFPETPAFRVGFTIDPTTQMVQ